MRYLSKEDILKNAGTQRVDGPEFHSIFFHIWKSIGPSTVWL